MTGSDDRLRIASRSLSVQIARVGAELQDLSDADGRCLQWNGDPTIWSGRAPVLFPVVGLLRDHEYRFDGAIYCLGKHGFARHSPFDVISHTSEKAELRLTPNEQTRTSYPFRFQLDITYAIEGSTLRATAKILNLGDVPMPASFGFHPALQWPLPYGQAREHHHIVFHRPETNPIRRINTDGLLAPEHHPSPVIESDLHLRDDLFVDDALIFDRIASRGVTYGAPDGPAIDVRFDDFSMLGVWSKPGANFVCIEPWQGIADPVGFEGDIWEKPGIVRFEPGEARSFTMTLTLRQPPA